MIGDLESFLHMIILGHIVHVAKTLLNIEN